MPNTKNSQVFSLPTNEPEIMYLIILFVFTATLNLSPNNSFYYNYEESTKWNTTGNLGILFSTISYPGQLRFFFLVILFPEDPQFERTAYRI